MGAKRELRIFLGTVGAHSLFASAPGANVGSADAPDHDSHASTAGEAAYVDFDHPRFACDVQHGAFTGRGDAPPPMVPVIDLAPRPRAEGVFHLPSGRPLRVEGEARVAPARASGSWIDRPEPLVAGLDPATRKKLGAAWLDQALDEHASVGSFARLALALLAIGAPAALIARTEQAALEEVEHARLCFALASAYLGSPVGPGALEVGPIARPEIVELALESWRDGCLGEGAAAAIARAARRRAHDPAVCAALTTISRDEGAHAELAWDILGLCLARGGREVADALREEVAKTPRAPDLPEDDAGEALAALLAEHGHLGPADRARCAAENARTAVRRAGWLLAPGTEAAGGKVRPGRALS
jgi:hypothetical protein